MRKKTSHHYLFLLLVIAFAAASFCYFERNVLVSYFIKAQVRALTGTDAAPQQVKIFKSKDSSDWVIQIKKMLIKNPDRFEIPNMVQLSDVQIVFNPWHSLVESRWHILSLYAYLPRTNFQNNGRGILNIATTPAIQALYGRNPPVRRTDFLIDHMEFKFGKLYRINYEKSPPSMELHSLKGKRLIYRNVDDPKLVFQAPAFALLDHIHFEDKDLLALLKAKVEGYREVLKAP